MKQVSWTQLFITIACFGAILLAHYAGSQQGILVSLAVALLMWLREPPKGGPPPGVVKSVAVAFILGVLASSAAAHS